MICQRVRRSPTACRTSAKSRSPGARAAARSSTSRTTRVVDVDPVVGSPIRGVGRVRQRRTGQVGIQMVGGPGVQELDLRPGRRHRAGGGRGVEDSPHEGLRTVPANGLRGRRPRTAAGRRRPRGGEDRRAEAARTARTHATAKTASGNGSSLSRSPAGAVALRSMRLAFAAERWVLSDQGTGSVEHGRSFRPAPGAGELDRAVVRSHRRGSIIGGFSPARPRRRNPRPLGNRAGQGGPLAERARARTLGRARLHALALGALGHLYD